MNADDAMAFVEEVASQHPIHSPQDWYNECRFCGVGWAESDYNEYKQNVAILTSNPQSHIGPGQSPHWEHHADDCLWVVANQIRESEE